MEPLVRLRLDIEGFKSATLHNLGLMHSEFGKMLEAKLQAMISSEQVEDLIRQEADRAVRDVVQGEIAKYLRYGDGRKTVEELAKERLNDYFAAREP